MLRGSRGDATGHEVSLVTVATENVEFRVIIFHCPHWRTTALSKAFSFLCHCSVLGCSLYGGETSPVRSWLLGWLHCALQVWRRILARNWWCVPGPKTDNRLLLMIDEVTYTFYICSGVWPFLRRMQAGEKYMESRSSEKSLSFYFHTGLVHNFNRECNNAQSFQERSDSNNQKLRSPVEWTATRIIRQVWYRPAIS